TVHHSPAPTTFTALTTPTGAVPYTPLTSLGGAVGTSHLAGRCRRHLSRGSRGASGTAQRVEGCVRHRPTGRGVRQAPPNGTRGGVVVSGRGAGGAAARRRRLPRSSPRAAAIRRQWSRWWAVRRFS